MKTSKMIDHTNLKAITTSDDIMKLCTEAIQNDFSSVCVNPCWVGTAFEQLKNSDVNVCTVIGFPLGANTTEVKAFETLDAIKNGATEIDFVINIGKLKENDTDYLYRELVQLRKSGEGYVMKAIIESCLLSDEEIVTICKMCVETGIDFVKTSTGMSTGGATIHAVELMKKTVGEKARVKASTGINDYQTVMNYVNVGAVRFGTSKGIRILAESEGQVCDKIDSNTY